MTMVTRILLWDDGLDYVNYLNALNAVGLTAEVSREADASCGGLVLPGGGDIVENTLPEDEWRVIAAFAAAEKPILGICRGLQALNVFFGGTLYGYVSGHQQPGADAVHAVRAVGELAELMGTEGRVTSSHHQAIRRLGAGLSVQWHPERQSFALRREDASDGAAVFWWLRREAERRGKAEKGGEG